MNDAIHDDQAIVNRPVTSTEPIHDDPTDAERLAEIEAREQGATPGPWYDYDNVHGAHITRLRDGTNIATVDVAHKVEDAHDRDANAAFIAHAREDVRYLLDRVKAANSENARLTEQLRYANIDALNTAAELEAALHNQDTLAEVLSPNGQIGRLEARTQEQEAEIARLTAAGLSAESKWADAVEKLRGQEAVIQALRGALVRAAVQIEYDCNICGSGGSSTWCTVCNVRVVSEDGGTPSDFPHESDCLAALNPSSATDGEQ